MHLVWTSNQRYHWNCHRSSCKWQQAVIFCFCCLINTLIRLRHHKLLINLFYFMNSLLKHYCYLLHRYHIKEGKFILSFDQKLFLRFDWYFSFEKNKFVVFVILTIIYIKYCLIFQTSDLKLTLRCHWNHCRPNCKWQRAITAYFCCCIDTII